MAELILHHYDEAPFAEKARIIFGINNLTWRPVIVLRSLFRTSRV